jgi:small nuclear ribonucleoprotein (snRNP)-like protein
MVRKTLLVATMTSALLTPSRSSAQQTAPREAEMWRTLVAALKPAALVSVQLKDGVRFKGTLLRVDDDMFAVKPQTRIPVPAREVRFDEVALLRPEKRAMSPGKKVLLGVGIGAAVYVLSAALLLAATGWD